MVKKDRCVYDLVHAVEPERFEAGQSDFARFVAGFATLPEEG